MLALIIWLNYHISSKENACARGLSVPFKSGSLRNVSLCSPRIQKYRETHFLRNCQVSIQSLVEAKKLSLGTIFLKWLPRMNTVFKTEYDIRSYKYVPYHIDIQ